MQSLTDLLDHFPIVTFTFVALVIVACVKSVAGDLDYTSLVDQVKDIGIGLGVIGAARGVHKLGGAD